MTTQTVRQDPEGMPDPRSARSERSLRTEPVPGAMTQSARPEHKWIQPSRKAFIVGDSTGTEKSKFTPHRVWAALVLTNTGTNAVVKTTTNLQGAFVFPVADLSNHEIAAYANGFAPETRNGLELAVSQNVNASFKVVLGAVPSQVVVEAGVTLVDTRESRTGETISQRSVEALGNGNCGKITGSGAPRIAHFALKRYLCSYVSLPGAGIRNTHYALKGGGRNSRPRIGRCWAMIVPGPTSRTRLWVLHRPTPDMLRLGWRHFPDFIRKGARHVLRLG